MRNLLNQEHYYYSFYQDGDDYYLSATCGTSAVYEVEIKLTEEEKKEYLKSGKSFVESLASNIVSYPTDYQNRS